MLKRIAFGLALLSAPALAETPEEAAWRVQAQEMFTERARLLVILAKQGQQIETLQVENAKLKEAAAKDQK